MHFVLAKPLYQSSLAMCSQFYFYFLRCVCALTHWVVRGWPQPKRMREDGSPTAQSQPASQPASQARRHYALPPSPPQPSNHFATHPDS